MQEDLPTLVLGWMGPALLCVWTTSTFNAVLKQCYRVAQRFDKVGLSIVEGSEEGCRATTTTTLLQHVHHKLKRPVLVIDMSGRAPDFLTRVWFEWRKTVPLVPRPKTIHSYSVGAPDVAPDSQCITCVSEIGSVLLSVNNVVARACRFTGEKPPSRECAGYPWCPTTEGDLDCLLCGARCCNEDCLINHDCLSLSPVNFTRHRAIGGQPIALHYRSFAPRTRGRQCLAY